MDAHFAVGLLLFEIVLIGFFAILVHVNVLYRSRFGHLESTQSIWPRASKTLLTPAKWGFPLWLIYGISFNCLTRSLLYSLLQLVNLIRPNQSLGLTGDFIITCACTFVGSFAATSLYKFEDGSLAIVFSGALAISSVPTGITTLIINRDLKSTGIWVLWVVSIIVFSLLASFIVFRFITISRSVLSNYSLKKFESQIPPTPEESAQNSTKQNSSESNSSEENSTEPVPTLKELIDQGSTLEDVVKTLIETRKPKQSKKQGNLGDAIAAAVSIFFLMFLPTTFLCRIIYTTTYGDWHGNPSTEEISYLGTVLVVITQFMDLMSYAVLTIWVQGVFVISGTSLANWCWYVLIMNLPCFSVQYLANELAPFVKDEFIAELLRVPFKFAAVGFISSATYYIVCLKKAKEILSAAEPQELDSFNVETA